MTKNDSVKISFKSGRFKETVKEISQQQGQMESSLKKTTKMDEALLKNKINFI